MMSLSPVIVELSILKLHFHNNHLSINFCAFNYLILIMKGRYKARKGHFSPQSVPHNKGIKSEGQKKLKTLKRTYIRVSKKTHEKVVKVPRSVKYHAANDGQCKQANPAVLLRPTKDSKNLNIGKEERKNDNR